MRKAVFHWSGGKDSSLALYKVLQGNEYEIVQLLTTVNSAHKRISMHGVRDELLERQAKSISIPLHKLMIPEMPSMQVYEALMNNALSELKQQDQDTDVSVFGDIFLEDLRAYREQQLAALQMECVFPLWKIPSADIIREFIDLGFKAVVVCVNARYLDKTFAGRLIDNSFLNDLPAQVDPCGENGEYHSFVYDGPIFNEPIQFETGETVFRSYTTSSDDIDNGFWYCDLMPLE